MNRGYMRLVFGGRVADRVRNRPWAPPGRARGHGIPVGKAIARAVGTVRGADGGRA